MNSKASMTPRSIAGMISPPGSWVTAMPIAWFTSADRPTVRYFSPCMSAAVAGAFSNQPSGWVGIGSAKKPTTGSPSWSCTSSR